MTKDEFIDAWVAEKQQAYDPNIRKSDAGIDWPHTDGSLDKHSRWLALQCSCGAPTCEGWQMVPEEFAGVLSHAPSS